MSFKYDPNLVPDVKLEREWPIENGILNQVYRAGDWSFETSEEANVQYAKSGIYAWIAWHDFLVANKKVKSLNATAKES